MRYFALAIIYTLLNSPAATMESAKDINRRLCYTRTEQLAHQQIENVSNRQTAKEAITNMLFDILKAYRISLQSLTLGLVGNQSLEDHLSKHISDEIKGIFLIGWTECEFAKKEKLAINTQLNPCEHFKTLENSKNADIVHELLLETLRRCLKEEDSKPFYPLLYHLLTSDVVLAETKRDNTILLAFAKSSKFAKAIEPKYEDLEYPFVAVLKSTKYEPENFTLITAYYNIKSAESGKESKLRGTTNSLIGSKMIDIRKWTPLFGIGDLSTLNFCLAFLPREILIGKYKKITEHLFSKLSYPIINNDGLVKPIRIIKTLASCSDDRLATDALSILSEIAISKTITGNDAISKDIQEAANDAIDSIASLFISCTYQCLQFNQNEITESIKDTHKQLSFTAEERLRNLSIQHLCRIDSRITNIYHVVYISMLFLDHLQDIENNTNKTTLKTYMCKHLLELLDHIYNEETKDDDARRCISVFKQFINGTHDTCINMTDAQTRTTVDFRYAKYNDEPFSYKILGYSLAKCVELNKTIAEAYIAKMLKEENIEKYKETISNLRKEIGLNLPFLSMEYSTCAQAESDFLALEQPEKQADDTTQKLYKQKIEIDSQIEKYREKITQKEITEFKEGLKSKKEPTKPKTRKTTNVPKKPNTKKSKK